MTILSNLPQLYSTLSMVLHMTLVCSQFTGKVVPLSSQKETFLERHFAEFVEKNVLTVCSQEMSHFQMWLTH